MGNKGRPPKPLAAAPQREILEYIASLDDKEFIETCFKIVDKERHEVPFIFNVTQTRLWAQMTRLNVVLKYRKPGVSVFVQSLMLTKCLRAKHQNAVVLSFDVESTRRMLERTQWMLDNMPFEVKLDRESKNEFKVVGNNSKMYIGVAGSRAFGRGDDVTFLHISELAWWENPDILTGIFEALTKDAIVFIESTANGPNNLYARMYRKGKSGTSEWLSHFFGWNIDPELQMDVPPDFAHTEEEKVLKIHYNLTDRQLAWRRWKINNMIEPELFPQEYPLNDKEAFLVLGDCVFDRKAMAKYGQLATDPTRVGELTLVA